MPIGVYVLALAVFVVGTDKDLIVGVLPSIASDMHVSVATAGQLATVFAVAYAFGAPVLAVVTSNVDRRRLLSWALAGFAVANLVSATAPSYPLLLGSRVLAALTAALYTPAAMAAAARIAPPERTARALAVVTMGFSAAAILGVPLGTLLAAAVGWRAAFVMISVLALVATLGLFRGLGVIPRPGVIGLSERVGVLRNPRVLRLLAVSAATQCAGFTVLLYLGPLLAETAGITVVQLAALLIVFGVAGLAGNAFAGRFTDRFGPERVLSVALIWVTVALVAFTAIARSLPGAYVAVCVWALAAWMVPVPQQARILRLEPRASAVAISLNSSAMHIGSAVAGGFGGVIVEKGHVTALPIAAAAASLLALAVLVADARLRRRAASIAAAGTVR